MAADSHSLWGLQVCSGCAAQVLWVAVLIWLIARDEWGAPLSWLCSHVDSGLQISFGCGDRTTFMGCRLYLAVSHYFHGLQFVYGCGRTVLGGCKQVVADRTRSLGCIEPMAAGNALHSWVAEVGWLFAARLRVACIAWLPRSHEFRGVQAIPGFAHSHIGVQLWRGCRSQVLVGC